jgi:myo-inositol-1(or 4)-monophosphatase
MDWMDRALRVAADAAVEAGSYAKRRFGGSVNAEHKDDRGDLVTEVDVETDAMIVQAIREQFPDHGIDSEEAGATGTGGEFVWHVDPLDGTNNYALGIPLYGVSISLSRHGEPVLGVVYDSHLEDLYTATRKGGAYRNGAPIRAKETADLRKGTISWIQGHAVGKTDETALRLRNHLELHIKRVLRVWAPSLTWAMLARGDLQGIVLYNSEGGDLYAGMLIAREAGARITDYEGRPIGAIGAEPYLVAAHPAHHDALLRLVREAVERQA